MGQRKRAQKRLRMILPSEILLILDSKDNQDPAFVVFHCLPSSLTSFHSQFKVNSVCAQVFNVFTSDCYLWSFFVKEKDRLLKKCLFHTRKKRFCWLLVIRGGGCFLGVCITFLSVSFVTVFFFRETMKREPPPALKPKLDTKSGELRN